MSDEKTYYCSRNWRVGMPHLKILDLLVTISEQAQMFENGTLWFDLVGEIFHFYLSETRSRLDYPGRTHRYGRKCETDIIEPTEHKLGMLHRTPFERTLEQFAWKPFLRHFFPTNFRRRHASVFCIGYLWMNNRLGWKWTNHLPTQLL